uniref:Uncharacterized protein n=1 Tax=Anguilla anguilla TaxID=7936 RepID=A0A0E9XRI4_ANGAN
MGHNPRIVQVWSVRPSFFLSAFQQLVVHLQRSSGIWQHATTFCNKPEWSTLQSLLLLSRQSC